MKMKFEGYSDDTFGAYWEGGDVDNDDGAQGSLRILRVDAGDHRLLVTGQYSPHSVAGTWMIGLAMVDEHDALPPWSMAWRFSGYTPQLFLDVPEDFRVTLVHPAPEDD